MRALDSQPTVTVHRWHISTASSGGDGCVEAGYDPALDLFVVRHSKKRDGAEIVFDREAWAEICAAPGRHFVKIGPDAFELRNGGHSIVFNSFELWCFERGVEGEEFSALSLAA